jgi:hypothetical protein
MLRFGKMVVPQGCGMDCGLGGNPDYTGHMRKLPIQPAARDKKRSSYVPGSQGRFITGGELAEWWLACNCSGQAPILEKGNCWFIDPPMMWEARGETVLKRTLHVLPPALWRRLN